MATMMATPKSVVDTSWYPDSRTTNHCTPNINNLMSQASYFGAKQLNMGDGIGLHINMLVILSFVFNFILNLFL